MSSEDNVSKDDIMIAFDSAIGSLMGMRMLLDKILPDGVELVAQEEGACRHENRAPSDPSFCLDCEQTVPGASAGFTGGDGS